MPSRWFMPSEKVPTRLSGHVAEADDVEHFAHPAAGDAVAVGQPREVVGGTAAADDGFGVQERPDRPERVGQLVVGLAVHADFARSRGVEAQDHAHGGRLAGPVGAEEAGHLSGLDGEGDLIDRNGLAVALGQVLCLDHGASFPRRSGPGGSLRSGPEVRTDVALRWASQLEARRTWSSVVPWGRGSEALRRVRGGQRRGVAIPVRGAKQRALLALLALNRGAPVSADRLIDQLWGDGQTAKPANALQAQIVQLRRTLGASAIVTSESGYALDVSAADLDAARFEDLVAEGRRLSAEGEPRAGVRRAR